jgi:hypothetical protein
MENLPEEKYSKSTTPVVGNQYKRPKTWSFSFCYFNQIKFFGLDRISPEWFVSFIERLQDLSNTDLEVFFKDTKKKLDYRYHEINWDSKNVPIKRADLKWLPSDYLNNENEYPFYQFQISKANGRVIGFWNEESSIFYIVLLDPHHNIQPSKSYNYKIDDCYPLSSQYSSLCKDIDDVLRTKSCKEDCPVKIKLKSIPTQQNQTNIMYCYLEDDYYRELQDKLGTKSISDIIELGLLSSN